ncbi:2Fe-2S iron-sulfur cluster-binding protein [Streptomyces sp. NBC_00523]|uniref:2Fe-2S iron-sulfur cluster-binding protein n=1 Tax=unclassified Streptomyces TaxID=2593676 RepID=UPI002E808D2D|nr:2Fe-2S iron-sulfur cluster-binding protein [Streptomyces sp. NBC_00523]WUD00383.1 2Fe-2S iron-sulfur cluster-binding protein [Streptomyces sp. NBC_00523]
MSKENPAEQQHGGWQPTPQGGDYDGEATAFVQLPPEDLADIPLAAPGHGYTPPMILPLTPAADRDPAATGNWVVQTPEQQPGQPAPDAVHWPDPNQQSGYGYPHPEDQQPTGSYQEPYGTDQAATGQWAVDTSSWPAPAAPLSDDSGELYTPPPVADWYADRPATLPGGAPAPWAVPDAAGTPEPDASEAAEPEAAGAPADTHGPADALAGGPAESAPEAAEPADDERPAPEADALADAPDAEPAPDPVAAEPGAEPAGEAVPDAEGPEAEAVPPAEVPETPAPEGPPLPSEHPAASYVLHVNGVDRPVTDAWIGESLLYVLRERLGLAGAKDGCSQGECGACNVQVDGRLVASCLVPAATTAGSEVRTVEGLAVDGEPSDVQRALADCGAVQCGFCIPGMAMTVHDLLEGNHRPSELETRRALCGNLCRCSGYRGVLDAVNEVIAGREAAAEAVAEETGSGEPEEPRIPHQAAPGAGSVQAHQQDGGMA